MITIPLLVLAWIGIGLIAAARQRSRMEDGT